jgi:hypothetical protein
MSERYLVTGAQLALLQETESKTERKQMVDEIVDKQFVGNSELTVEEDAKKTILKKPCLHIEFDVDDILDSEEKHSLEG